MRKITHLKSLKKAGLVIVILLTSYFLLKTFTSYYENLQSNLTSISPINVSLSFAFFLGYLYLRAYSWKSIVNFLGGNINKPDALTIWFFSEVTRFIPGNIWAFASRSYLSQQKQVRRNTSFLVIPIEIITITTTASLISVYAIFKNLELLKVDIVVVFIVTMFVALLGLVLLRRVLRRMFTKLFEHDLDPKSLLFVFGLQALGWSLYSLATIVLANNISTQNALILFSCAALSWLVGYLSIITPMGLGVREGAFVILASPYIGTANALFAAVLSRMILITAELANVLFWIYLDKHQRTK